MNDDSKTIFNEPPKSVASEPIEVGSQAFGIVSSIASPFIIFTLMLVLLGCSQQNAEPASPLEELMLKRRRQAIESSGKYELVKDSDSIYAPPLLRERTAEEVAAAEKENASEASDSTTRYDESKDAFDYESYGALEAELILYCSQMQKLNDAMISASGDPFALEPVLDQIAKLNPKLQAAEKSIAELAWSSKPSSDRLKNKARAFHAKNAVETRQKASDSATAGNDLTATALYGLAKLHQARSEKPLSQ